MSFAYKILHFVLFHYATMCAAATVLSNESGRSERENPQSPFKALISLTYQACSKCCVDLFRLYMHTKSVRNSNKVFA